MDLCEFKANLVYTSSSRTARAVTQRNPVSKNKQTSKHKTNPDPPLTQSMSLELVTSLFLMSFFLRVVIVLLLSQIIFQKINTII